jgi:hypothetical protein
MSEKGDNMVDYQKLDEAVLAITGGPNWDEFLTIMDAEANAAIENEMQAETMEEIKYWRGYRQGLVFVANMRQVTKTLIEQSNANV